MVSMWFGRRGEQTVMWAVSDALGLLYLVYIDGLVQDCGNSSALAMELLQSCTKLTIWGIAFYVAKFFYGSARFHYVSNRQELCF